MPTIGSLTSFTANTTAVASQVNTNFSTIRTAVNTYCAFLDAASQTFTGNATVSGTLTSTGVFTASTGVAVTGNSTITGTLTALTGITSSGTAALATVTVSTALTVTAGNLTMSAGQAIGKRVDDGNSSTADTIDWNTGNAHRSKLTDNCTYTFSNPATGAYYSMEVLQDATGSRIATWPATVKWDNGTTPTLTTTANKKDVFGFYYNGAVYIGWTIALNVTDTT